MDETFEMLVDDLPKLDPYQRLWIGVTILAIKDIKSNDEGQRDSAIKWIFDNNNPFFDMAAESLRLDPAYLRSEILKRMVN